MAGLEMITGSSVVVPPRWWRKRNICGAPRRMMAKSCSRVSVKQRGGHNTNQYAHSELWETHRSPEVSSESGNLWVPHFSELWETHRWATAARAMQPNAGMVGVDRLSPVDMERLPLPALDELGDLYTRAVL
eukprot:4847011-Pyramimonas_sp.AAC.1